MNPDKLHMECFSACSHEKWICLQYFVFMSFEFRGNCCHCSKESRIMKDFICCSARSLELWFQLLCTTGFSKSVVSLEWLLLALGVNKGSPLVCLQIQPVLGPRDSACSRACTCLYHWIKHPTGRKLGIQTWHPYCASLWRVWSAKSDTAA